jgi:two-component system phosphate regulon response regulator PhoB
VHEEAVELTATEFRLLLELVRNQGKVQTRDHLLDKVWGYQFDGYARTVDTHIRRLRQKLGEYAEWVETIRGVGYRFRGNS